MEEMEVDKQIAHDSSNREVNVDDENTSLHTDEEGGLKVDDDIYIPPPLKTIHQLDPTAARLMIAKIVNKNFKSYGGVQEIGPFHKCFSAIVGPNGSGKSNVIDSMLFVFGYRASKIRSKKISVLIHNSTQHTNVNSCTVSVHFQQIVDKNEVEYDIVPNSEFVISRTAFKDNTSYYELNNKKVHFKEIAKLLRSHGVDLDHNRFLILQGEVEQIAMMKPKAQNENDVGMLEFLEDIIGTVRYKEPLQKLSEKIDLLTDCRHEKLNRLKIVEKEKEALQEPMQEAIEYLHLENEIKTMLHQLYCYERFVTTKELEKQESKINELDKDLSDLMNKMKEIQNDKEQKSKEMADKGAKWSDLQKQKDEITAKFDKIRKHDESLHAELVETNKRRKTNIASVKTEKLKLEEQSKLPHKYMKDIEEYEGHIETHERDKEKEEKVLEKLMAEVSKQTEPLLNERSAFETELISLRKDVDQAQSKFDIAQSELQLYTSIEKTEKEKLEKLRESLKLTTDNLTKRNEELRALDGKIPNTEQTLMSDQKELQEVKMQEVESSSKLKRMRISFDEQRCAMQASRSRNKVIDCLMREKREGRIPGVLGRLGDLGAIDGKYDVAISTACGPLNNIVVDTVSTAQACITFLRQNDIGRATFIPLEKQQRLLPRCQQKIQTPQNVPRLFDLIRVEDERVLPAFYYGLQDTLVANDLNQATSIAYGQKRYRVVTLKGELIELSGTMSGGGRSVLKGRMGQKVMTSETSNVDIQKLESELNVTFERCNKLKARSHELENHIHSLSVELKEMKVNREKICIELKTLQAQEPALKAQVKAQEKKVIESVSDQKRVNQLRSTMTSAEDNLEKVKKKSEVVEKKVTVINEKIEEVAGSSVKNQRKKVASLNKLIDTTKAETRKLQIAIKTAERNVAKITQRIETLENDIETSEHRLRDIQKEKQEIEEKAKEYIAEIEQLTEGLAERDEVMSSLKEEINALDGRENKMKSLKIDLDQKVKECKAVIKGLSLKIPEYTKKMRGIRLQQIPGETLDELQELTENQLLEFDEQTHKIDLQETEKRLPADIPNMQIIEEYREKDAVYLKRVGDLEQITTERNKIRDIYETARRRRIQEFLTGFTIITDKLKEMYQMITLGGNAELELVDSLDPFSEGIAFSVRPPKKTWKNICNLSGGEKTLSSLALVFALHHYKPTPLYFMDEIDAALDFKNVSIVGNYIKERTKNAQFIVISLRSNMFELSDYLVGIYKTYNITKCVTIDLRKCYMKNGIAPPTQLTTRDLQSQARKFSSQTQQGDTCKTQSIQNSQATTKPVSQNENTPFDLPNLQLCPTPQKTQQITLSSKSSSSSLEEASSGSQPLKKKRKG